MSKRRAKKSKAPAKSAAPAKQAPIRVNAMDVFRAKDAASKSLVQKMSQTADGFENFVSRLGLNQQNALSDSTYEFDLITRNRLLLEAAYRGSWIAGRGIDCVAEDMTRAGVNITTSKGTKDIPKLKSSMFSSSDLDVAAAQHTMGATLWWVFGRHAD